MLLILRALNIAPLQHVVYKHLIAQLQDKMGVGVTAVAFFIISYFEPHCKSRTSLRFEVLQNPRCLPNCGEAPAAPPKPPLAKKRREARSLYNCVAKRSSGPVASTPVSGRAAPRRCPGNGDSRLPSQNLVVNRLAKRQHRNGAAVLFM